MLTFGIPTYEKYILITNDIICETQMHGVE